MDDAKFARHSSAIAQRVGDCVMASLPSVPRLCSPEMSTVVCIATGPSLTQADVDFVRGKAKVVVVSNAYQYAPWADVLWASDAHWYGWHKGVPGFTGLKYTLRRVAAEYKDVQVLRETGQTGLELSPTAVRHGNNSGYAAINCAVHLGASRIVLLGYDMQLGPKGERHFFGDHPQRQTRNLYDSFRKFYPELVQPLKDLGVTVINCTRRSALNCFPKQPLESVFAQNEVAA